MSEQLNDETIVNESENGNSSNAENKNLLPGQQEGETIEAYATRVAQEKAELEAKTLEIEQKNKELYARTKKAEKSKEDSTGTHPPDLETVLFFSQGGTKEEYEQIHIIMKGTGVSFEEAQKNPLYTSFKESIQRKKQDEEAQLGKSKGSFARSDSAFKPGMTAEEHKEAWKKANQA